jgi:hypothetical protein
MSKNNTKDVMFNGTVLPLQRFEIENMMPNPRIAIIAKSGSGKSWIVRDLLYHMRDIPCGSVIAPTDKLTGFFNDFFPPSFIHHEYKPDIIPKVLQRQMIMIEKNKKRIKEGKKTLDARSFLIMDDCMSSKHLWLKDPNVLSIFNEGRHYQLTFFLTMQYSLGIQPELRSNFDYIFLLGEDFITNRKKLYDHYAGMFPSFDSFQQVFSQVTDNYGCMVINNRLRTSDITKKVFWYKAKEIVEPFQIGAKKFRKFHEKNFDPEYYKKPMVFDANNFGQKKNTKQILVKLS